MNTPRTDRKIELEYLSKELGDIKERQIGILEMENITNIKSLVDECSSSMKE